MKTEMAIMFMILIALLLNRDDLESSGWFSRDFIRLIYVGKSEKSKADASISFIISVSLYLR